MRKKVLLGAGVILLLAAFLFLYPFNFYHYFTAEQKVTNLLYDPHIRENTFGGDSSEITNVKYLGSYIYQVKTEENTFLVKIKTSKSSHSIVVFEQAMHVTQFKGYK